MGEIIVNARIEHTITLMKPQRGLIILGLGNSRKSAPFIPKLSETIPREKTSIMASVKPIPAIRGEGDIKMALTKKQTRVITKLRRVAKKYFALTRLLTDIGDEYTYHTLPPSEPVVMLPREIAIKVPGSKVI
jgi:hypothetical protein